MCVGANASAAGKAPSLRARLKAFISASPSNRNFVFRLEDRAGGRFVRLVFVGIRFSLNESEVFLHTNEAETTGSTVKEEIPVFSSVKSFFLCDLSELRHVCCTFKPA